MKKPLFVIAEILFTTAFVVTAAAAAAVAVDLKTDMFRIDQWDPLKLGRLLPAESSTPVQVSEISAVPSGKLEESSEEPSEEPSKEEIELVLYEPDGLESQPKDLSELLKAYEYTYEKNLPGNRLIVIEPDHDAADRRAVVYCYEKSEFTGYWWNIAGENQPLCEEAYIGKNGSAYEIKNNDKKTPAGIWTAGEGFYTGEKPETDYPLFAITKDTYWITDEKSSSFNCHVEGTADKDWTTALHMADHKELYQYGLAVNYNTEPPVKGKGSALFLQCGSAATDGSIALPTDTMKTILEWLDKESTPLVWITP